MEKQNEHLHPSPRAKQAKIRNGAVLPTNWYMMPPKGGPLNHKPPLNIVLLT